MRGSERKRVFRLFLVKVLMPHSARVSIDAPFTWIPSGTMSPNLRRLCIAARDSFGGEVSDFVRALHFRQK